MEYNSRVGRQSSLVKVDSFSQAGPGVERSGHLWPRAEPSSCHSNLPDDDSYAVQHQVARHYVCLKCNLLWYRAIRTHARKL